MSASVGSLIVDLIARTSQFSGPMRGAVSSVQALSTSIDSMGGRIGGLVGNIARIGGAIGGVASIGWGIKLASDAEQAEVGFTTLLGSGEAAREMMQNLEEFAARTPFEFPELRDSAKKMLALGFAADEVMPTLQALGDATSGLGGNSELLDRITVALGQMRAKGVVSAEEMRQLAEAGIPAWKMLADAIGVDIPTAMDMVKDRAVQSSQAVPALLQGITDKFGGGMEAQSQTLGGIFSTLRDNVGFLFRDMGQSITEALDLKSKGEGVNAFLARIRQTVANLSGTAVRFMAEWGSSAVKLIGFLAGVRIALTAVSAAQRLIATTQIFINALSGPKGWAAIAAGIAVATAAALSFDGILSQIANKGEEVAQKVKGIDGSGLDDLKAKADEATKSLQKLGAAIDPSTNVQNLADLAESTEAAFNRMRQAQLGYQERIGELREMGGALSPRMQKQGILNAIQDAANGSNTGQLAAQKEKFDALANAPGRVGEMARKASSILAKEIDHQSGILETQKGIWEKYQSGQMSAAEAQRQMAASTEEATASLSNNQVALSGVIGQMPKAIAALGGLDAAIKAAEKAADHARSPLENLVHAQQHIDNLFKAGLIDAAQKQQLLKRATEEFDKELGGPAEKIKELRRQIETFGQSSHEAMLAQFKGVEGVTTQQLGEMEKLAKKLEKLELQKKMFEEGKQIADSLRTPVEQMHDEADHLQKLLDAGALSENQFAQAMVNKREEIFGNLGQQMHPGNLQRGSREAVLAIQSAATERDRAKERSEEINLQKQQLQEQKRSRENLDNINDSIRPIQVEGFA